MAPSSLTVAVTGATGLIGSALVERLRGDGHTVRRVVRRDPAPGDVTWDPARGSIEAAALEGTDAVVHLAGAGIGDHRWTPEYKRELRDSRLLGTGLVARTLAELERPPHTLVSASAIGIYGSSETETFDESSPPGQGFLAELCGEWEAATGPAEAAGVRVAHIRSGIVLSKQGGALRKQLPLYRLGLGGKLGSGRQWQSWVTIDDEVGAIVHLLRSDVRGPVNLTAPAPVTQADFAHTLARVLHRPAFLPIPRFAPKLLLGDELATNLLFTGQKVLPTVLSASGYTFEHPELDGALRAVLGKR